MMMLDAQGPQPLVYAASVSLEPISLDQVCFAKLTMICCYL